MKIHTRYVLTMFLLCMVFLFSHPVRAVNSDVVINEIAAFETTGNEWVEIYNNGSAPVDLTGWKFWENSTNHSLTLAQGANSSLAPGAYAIIAQDAAAFMTKYASVSVIVFDSSWGTLNESGEEIGLKDAGGNFIEKFTYLATTAHSLERKDATVADYTTANWVEHPSGQTAGIQNTASAPSGEIVVNQLPVAFVDTDVAVPLNVSLPMDGSGSHDADGSIVSYTWDFGDGSTGNGATVQHAYASFGTMTVTLTVMDDKGGVGTASVSVIVSNGDEEAASPLRINEFMANPNDGEKEWVELFNTSDTVVDLTGWTLEDATGHAIASPTSTVSAHGFFVAYLSSVKLNNTGDMIRLKDGAGQVVDEIVYGGTGGAVIPEKGEAMARIIDGVDTDNHAVDFARTTTPTPGSSNVITAVETVPPSPTSTPPAVTAAPSGNTNSGNSNRSYNVHDMVINELVSDPGDGMDEFVELFNTTWTPITLDGWWLEDGSETKTMLSGSVDGRKFFVIERPKGSLNNAGDMVVLFDPSGKEIDHVTYGTWDDGNLSDNAAVASDPYSLARKVDGQDSDNDYFDWTATVTITSGKNNIITIPKTTSGSGGVETVTPGAIILNEILPNPTGADDKDEFIEIKNSGKETVDVKNWKLGDSSAKRYVITQGTIAPGSFLVFKRAQTGIALNNTGGDEVKLYMSSGSLADQVQYTSTALENHSYAKNNDNRWVWTSKPTLGFENTIVGVESVPVIAIDVDTEVAVGEPVLFDASDSTSDSGPLTFAWDFGDGGTGQGETARHVYMQRGVFTVTATVADSTFVTSSKKVVMTVKDPFAFSGGPDGEAKDIIISEIFPNPAGADDGEFIELYNPTELPIDLSGMKLDDEDGGSHPYIFPDGTIIAPGEYHVFKRADTKLALNNTSDSVRLLAADNTVVLEVPYENVKEGMSYSLKGTAWTWTSAITPGAANVFVLGNKETAKLGNTKKKKSVATIGTTLEKIHDQDVGDTVQVSGVVAVLPNIFGTQYFYIVKDGDASAGVQVYMNKKNFPKLTVGDEVEVTGEIGDASGERRIKVISVDDIHVLGHGHTFEPVRLESDQISEAYDGALVIVQGEVTEVKKSSWYIDDGVGEVLIYLKAGANIESGSVKLGDMVSVTGIVFQTKAGFEILPRSQVDIEKTGVAKDAAMLADANGNTTEKTAETYLSTTAGGLTAIFLGLIAKTRGTFVSGLLKKAGSTAIGMIKKEKNLG